MYEYADKVIKKLNLKFIRLFSNFKSQLHVDEINVLSASKALYERLEYAAEEAFLLIAQHTYKKHGLKLKQLDRDWLLDFLEEYDAVTKYVYLHEVQRKQARFAESVIASRTKAQEVDTGLRYWANMVRQYAIEINDAALLQAYEDTGVKYVKWITTIDDRECKICRDRHGKIYPIDDIPPKPHIGCRCILKAYKGDDNE
ncbi:MAG: phage head morphogenesis protein [Faecalibacterium sp.]|nr:phage head morphogenesis protein [Ruminococcus sp.]MCM1391874.1 phage head morphogenesis protein [Ruminococcus sp.]MCM1485550.1 phage head morphogenesis protein [Faecalibacterium sp.]